MIDRREEPRYEIVAPIRIGDACGMTRNLSLEGVLFVSPVAFELGAQIRFIVQLAFSGTGLAMRLECTGDVTRSEQQADGQFATAATITELQVLTERPSLRSAASRPLEEA